MVDSMEIAERLVPTGAHEVKPLQMAHTRRKATEIRSFSNLYEWQ